VVEGRADERPVPVRERQEQRAAERRCCPRRDDEWLPAVPVSGKTEWKERERGHDIPQADDEADVRRRRAEILEEQWQQRPEETEPDAPEELSAEQRADVATYCGVPLGERRAITSVL